MVALLLLVLVCTQGSLLVCEWWLALWAEDVGEGQEHEQQQQQQGNSTGQVESNHGSSQWLWQYGLLVGIGAVLSYVQVRCAGKDSQRLSCFPSSSGLLVPCG